MPLLEVLTIEVGTTIVKAILKLWLKDSSIASDVSLTIADILKSRTTDKLAQRRAQRQFETIGEKVGENLLPIFESDGGKLDEGSREAVALAVAETLNTANISSEILAQHNLEPTELAKHLWNIPSPSFEHFNWMEKSLYRRIISESCVYIIDIASQLPKFTEQTFSEVLKREGQLLILAEEILQEVHQMRKQLNLKEVAARFELDYRRAIVRNLDDLQLFGTDISTLNRRQRLSVAYVTLSVKPTLKGTSVNEGDVQNKTSKSLTDQQDMAGRNLVIVDKALADSRRLLIRGLAGSGKTTLLQWIAVNSASRSFKGILANWNDTVPFYIRLRHCVESGLPRIEDFPKLISTAILDAAPQEWMSETFSSGRAIVLVDGLDEVPMMQRENVRIWLKDLIGAYPRAHFVITSRPHAVEEGWMSNFGFNDSELQPMEVSEIHTFIDHWHAAVAEELHDEEEKDELLIFAKHLKDEIQFNRSLRNLATNPLLCAMLCALNRERRHQLPTDRIELYEACCKMLIERRDKERGIPLSDYPALMLTYRQRRVLLEDLAYWMIKNGWSEIEEYRTDERLAWKLTNMQGIKSTMSGAQVRQFFVERTSMIREPIIGYNDFTHRTFQEFLAAKAAVDEGDIGVLVEHALNDQWWEVIILASGLARDKENEELIQELIARGDQDSEHRHQLHLLAVSCLETPVKLGQNVKTAVELRLRALTPPTDMTYAQALASAGELAVPYLVYDQQQPSFIKVACIRTLELIGGRAALETIEGYAYDTHPTVVYELWRGWDFFNKEVYAKRILTLTLQEGGLVPKNVGSLSGFHYLITIKSLDLSGCNLISDLAPITAMTQLTSLNISSCWQIIDLTPLTNLNQLTSLDLSSCWQIRDLNPLANLKQLVALNLSSCARVKDLRPLRNLHNLEMVKLHGVSYEIIIPKNLNKCIYR